MPASGVVFAGQSILALKKIISLNRGANLVSSAVSPLTMGYPVYPTGTLVLVESTGEIYRRTATEYVLLASNNDVVNSVGVATQPELIGDIKFVEGSGIDLTQIGNNIIVSTEGGVPISVGYVFQEQLGIGDGSQTSFPLAEIPFSGTDIMVRVNGLTVPPSFYVYDGINNEIDFVVAPALGSIITAYYTLGLANVTSTYAVLSGTVNGVNDTFTFVGTPLNNNAVIVFKDGLLQPRDRFTVLGNTVTFNAGFIPVTGQILTVYFQNNTSMLLLSVQEAALEIGDGVSTVFTGFSFDPNEPESFTAFVDGVAIPHNWYTVINKTIIFMPGYTPAAGAIVEAHYYYVPDASTLQTEYYTLDATQIANAEVTLQFVPRNPTKVLLDVIRMGALEYGVDFVVTGQTLSWLGLGFAADAVIGTKIRVHYLVE